MALTDVKIRQAKPAEKSYRISDGGGLHLEIRATGAKVWLSRHELFGKPILFTIGSYPEVTLGDAREKRNWAKAQVAKGVNPTLARELERRQVAEDMNVTFKVVAEEWIASKESEWSEGYASQLKEVFSADVYPQIGSTPIKHVTPHDLLSMLRKIEQRGATTIAALARQRCSSVFRYAVATLRAESDPAGLLKGALKRNPVRHNPHITRDGLPELLGKIEAYSGYGLTKPAIKILAYTFVRTVEIRKSEWSEFDLEGDRFGLGGPAWVIPAERMKMRRKHIVPLSTQVVSILKDLRDVSGKRNFLFPNMRTPGKCMSITAINRVLERIGYLGEFSGHGFRSTASTALHEMGYNTDWIEMQLAHADRTVRGAYNHAMYLPERRAMMQVWADMLDSLSPSSQESKG